MSDDDVYTEWKERTRRVCKPCWELKYCPYGPLVEQSPLLPVIRSERNRHIERLQRCLETNSTGSVEPLTPDLTKQYKSWTEDEDLLLHQAWNEIKDEARLDAAFEQKNDELKIAAFLNLGELPPIHLYRVPFDLGLREIQEQDFHAELWGQILDRADSLREKYLTFLAVGREDTTKPLHAMRRLYFEQEVRRSDLSNAPDQIPDTFLNAQCTIFGHICPVFFAAEVMTETQEERRLGRRQLDFPTMMRIVRRDDYRCQHCQKKLQDNEVEFDHRIPVSKGGSSEEHNMRLTCFKCNRDKGDDFEP